ncbi:MAG: hypothetical protein U9N82_12495 [Thermodesulfobacteriota bacterium]|nr:hypothetical protein [Thermodesulfobacteriota bacterium]
MEAIKRAVDEGFIEAFPYESQFYDEEHYLYKHRADREPAIASSLPFYIAGPLQGAVRKWAGDTYALLDHVYFETEPMMSVQPGDLLDFSSAQEPEPIKHISMKKLSKQKIAKGKQLISKIRENQEKYIRLDRDRPIYDDAYFEALDYLNGDALDFPVQGEAKIEDSVTKFD